MARTKFLKRITMQKAIASALKIGVAFAAGVAAVEIPADPGALETAGPGLLLAIVVGAARAYSNMDKNRDKPGNPLGGSNTPSGY